MDWTKILPFIGALATGGVPALVATAASAVAGAVGREVSPTIEAIGAAISGATPEQMAALKKIDADLKVRMRELDVQELEANLKDGQAEHAETQASIRNGDNAEDPYVRHTRPMIARQSWYAMAFYVIVFEAWRMYLVQTGKVGDGASFDLAMVLGAPALTYIGFRSMFDKSGGLTRLWGKK